MPSKRTRIPTRAVAPPGPGRTPIGHTEERLEFIGHFERRKLAPAGRARRLGEVEGLLTILAVTTGAARARTSTGWGYPTRTDVHARARTRGPGGDDRTSVTNSLPKNFPAAFLRTDGAWADISCNANQSTRVEGLGW
jgi:hypothetical protein